MATRTRNKEWDAWAARELAAYPDRQEAAVLAAVEALDGGLSPTAAVTAARLNAGASVPAAELTALWEEVKALELVARELAAAKPSGGVTEAALHELAGRYEARLVATRELYSAARGSIVTSPAAATATAAQPLVPPARPPGPSMREFLADNSILIISIAGAVLLMVSTLLFEIYGTAGLGGIVQFGGVLTLNLVFGAAGYVCFSRPRLRLVGQIYLAIFALLAPLTVAAAWVFLDLASHGLTPEEAVGYGGLGCSALYAILAARLVSRGYAALSLLALAVGYAGVIASASPGVWGAPWFALIAFVYVFIANPPALAPRALSPFTRVAGPFVHGAAAVAFVWSAAEALYELGSSAGLTFQLSVTFGVLALAYVGHAWRSGHRSMLGFAWAGASLALLAVVEPLHWGSNGYVLALVALAWVYAIGARWMPGRGLRGFVRAAAAVQAAFPVLLSASPDGLQALALLAASGIGLLFALEDDRPAWLLLTAGIFTVDWFWMVKAVVPPPPNPSPDTLLMVYSPLPIVYGLVGLGLRLTRRPQEWAWPAYTGAAVVAIGVAVGATSSGDLELAGRWLAAYAVLAYIVAAVHRWWPAMLAALLAGVASAQLLLAAAGAATYWYPLVTAGMSWAFYAAGRGWAASLLGRTHRFTALGIAGITALACFGVPDFWAAGSTGSLAALAALAAAAGMVLLDGRLNRVPLFDYVAPAVASLAGFWIARYVDAQNLQVYVALTGATLIALGLVAAHDPRRPATLDVCRVAIAAGGVILLGTTAYQSVTEDAAASYTILWVIEAVAALLVGIGARSRTLVLVGSAGLATGALRALFLILESVQVYVVFGAIALFLLAGAGVLAAMRDRLSAARSAVRTSWDQWT